MQSKPNTPDSQSVGQLDGLTDRLAGRQRTAAAATLGNLLLMLLLRLVSEKENFAAWPYKPDELSLRFNAELARKQWQCVSVLLFLSDTLAQLHS